MAFRSAFLLCAVVAAVSGLHVPECGERSVIVQLFEWKWTDVAAECEAFLGPKGYCAVQVSPPTEHAVLLSRPWWERYQPVSYVLNSRSGTLEQFQQMVSRCSDAGIKVIAEVVLNNMAAMTSSGHGNAGSSYDATTLSFPAVPYDENDFNNATLCGANSTAYTEAQKARNCPVHGMTDLDQSRENVRETMTDYLDQLVDVGVVGFSVNAANYMSPADLSAIFSSVQSLPSGVRPLFLLEVYDMGEGPVTASEYNGLGMVSEYRFGHKLAAGMQDFRKLADIVDYSQDMVFTEQALVFVDNYATQRFVPGTLTHRTPREYTMATAFTLAFGYGTVRVMSSYEFSEISQGPPMSPGYSTLDVGIDGDGWCQNGWVCEHRWRAIFDLIPFHTAVQDKDLNHFTATQDFVAFSRGRTGFFAMTSKQSFTGLVQTNLAPGEYCEVIFNCAYKVLVDQQGRAHLNMSDNFNPILAIVDTQAPENNYQRTVVLMHKVSRPGEYVFFRGGVDHSLREGCTTDAETSDCSIPIDVRHENLNISDAYDAWRAGDKHLDWYGKEAEQGVFRDWQPQGSPGLWTTNDASDERRFHPLNTFGPHYWMLDMDMDCSKTEDGLFEVKAFMSDASAWEHAITNNQCQGAEPFPFSSTNHIAKCGALNVFHYDEGRCEIREL